MDGLQLADVLRKQTPLDVQRFLVDLDRATADLCAPYLDHLRSRRIEPSSKIIQDSLWGFIELTEAEVLLLDSPLLQRLRYIRQLGFAYLLFPNAGYSRFEHSLGVCHIVGQYAAALQKAQPHQSGTHQINVAPEDVRVLRLAALLHDVGHVSFSHVAERCWDSFPAMGSILKGLRATIHRKLPGLREKPAPAELLSVCVSTSPTVRSLLELAAETSALSGHPDRIIDDIAAYILGEAGAPLRWFLAELLSGDMDADKLDYIPRDCMVTGVPLPFDVKRLILKTRIAAGVNPDNVPFARLGVSLNGARALMDLTVSRMMLREKIYRHPKVLAAEAMFEAAFRLVASISPSYLSGGSVLGLDDETALRDLAEFSSLAGDHENEAIARRVRALGSALRARRLIKRAFVISAHFLPAGMAPEKRASLLALMDSAAERRQLSERIYQELASLLAATGRQALLPLGPEWLPVESADLTSGAGGAQHRPAIVGPNGAVLADADKWEYLLSNAEWPNALESASALGYVFAPEECRAAVHVAARNVFASEYGLVFQQPCGLLSKVTDGEISEIDAAVLAGGSDPDAERTVSALTVCAREDPTRRRALVWALRAAGVDVAEKLMAEHQGSVREKLRQLSIFEGYGDHRVDETRVLAWLSQFPAHLAEMALQVFLNVRVLDRKAFVEAFQEAIRSVAEPLREYVVVAPFTSSGDFMNYYATDFNAPELKGDLQIGEVVTFQTVGLAIEHLVAQGRAGSTLLVVDDVLGRARQAPDVLRIWFGEAPAEHAATLSSPLGPGSLEWLRSQENRSALVFAFGLAEGVQQLRTELAARELKLSVKVKVESNEAMGAFGAQGPLSAHFGSQQVAEFRDFCARAGEQLLRARAATKGWAPQRLANRALGYGNAAQLVATAYNTPTITLTALWARGSVDGKPWWPLLARRYRD